MVRGYQGDLKNNDEILACVKHFALYGASEAGRDYNTVDMSRSRMYNEYFAPYKAAVDEGAATVMTSFNLVDGVPATENKWLLDDVLRGQWGFDGMVVTDYGSIGEVSVHGLENLPKLRHAPSMPAPTWICAPSASSARSSRAWKTAPYLWRTSTRPCAVSSKPSTASDSSRTPYKFNDTKREKTHIYTKEHRADARRIAAETFVLLKNDGKVLPLDKKGKVALIGPMANTASNMPGTWSVAADFSKYKTLKQGFEDALKGKAELLYAKNSKRNMPTPSF